MMRITKVIFLKSPNLLSKLQTSSLNTGSEQIVPKDVVKNIGAYMDKTFNMETQVGQICRVAWFHILRNIGRIHFYLDTSPMEKLIHAFVPSKLHSNNSLLCGIPKNKTDKLH